MGCVSYKDSEGVGRNVRRGRHRWWGGTLSISHTASQYRYVKDWTSAQFRCVWVNTSHIQTLAPVFFALLLGMH